MRFLFYAGWVLLLIAFLITAVDPYLTLLGTGGMWVPALDVWYAYSPRTFILTQIRIEKFSPALWDPVIVTVLQIPGWLLFGLPGTAMTWFFRPNRVMSDDVREEYERQKESLFVLDELSRQARRDEDYDATEDDQAPVHLMFDLHESEDEDMRAAVIRGDIPAGYPPPEYLEDWNADLTREDADGMGGVNYDRLSVELDIGSLPPPGSVTIEEKASVGDNESSHTVDGENAGGRAHDVGGDGGRNKQ
ncbi:MAG: hypothetical protein H8E30_05080 [Alphaproteobacteria bacterium]|nr:hypothetical protein [Alphaproteobacteria bacterium]